jgi:hypothetical protein
MPAADPGEHPQIPPHRRNKLPYLASGSGPVGLAGASGDPAGTDGRRGGNLLALLWAGTCGDQIRPP